MKIMRPEGTLSSSPTLVLVHGGFHGAWCWELLIGELQALGYRATAMDLPIEDPQCGSDDYADVVCDAIGAEESVVLVGHSMGGLVIPVAASRRPTAGMVFLCAELPVAGLSLRESRSAHPKASWPENTRFTYDHEGRVVADPQVCRQLFFNDCRPDLQQWAIDRIRPQATKPLTEPSSLSVWPNVPSRYIACRDDRAVPAAWAREVVPERLGSQPIEIEGGHSPFLSRPKDLALALHEIVLDFFD
jgi:pimeloyl-ACP methyl ester carboxylesterase